MSEINISRLDSGWRLAFHRLVPVLCAIIDASQVVRTHVIDVCVRTGFLIDILEIIDQRNDILFLVVITGIKEAENAQDRCGIVRGEIEGLCSALLRGEFLDQ